MKEKGCESFPKTARQISALECSMKDLETRLKAQMEVEKPATQKNEEEIQRSIGYSAVISNEKRSIAILTNHEGSYFKNGTMKKGVSDKIVKCQERINKEIAIIRAR